LCFHYCFAAIFHLTHWPTDEPEYAGNRTESSQD
jgi:hypothetical protein